MQKDTGISNQTLAIKSSRNWLLHTRYVRGEHSLCLNLVENLQKDFGNTHRYACYIKGDNGTKLQGLVLADAGRLQEAIDSFHSCIKLHPHDPETLKQVGKCLYSQGRFQLSIETYLSADKLTKHPDSDIYYGLAQCSWSLGEPERGVEWAKAAVQAGGSERAGALLAKLLLACNNVKGALSAYDYALSNHACGVDTLAAAGALRLRAGDPRGAFQLLGAALAQQPTHHAAALALAAMLLQHDDVDAALARLKAALTAHTSCVAAHSNLGLALLVKKKYIAALTCLQRSLWSAPLSGRAAHNLGLALLICKRPASAFCRLASAAALDGSQPYTVLLIAIALERLGDSRADAAYARAISMYPEDPLIRINVAGRHARTGRLLDAVHEANLTAQLMQNVDNMNTQNAQLTSSLSTLLSLLREAGVELSEIPAQLPELGADQAEQEHSHENELFAPDEV